MMVAMRHALPGRWGRRTHCRLTLSVQAPERARGDVLLPDRPGRAAVDGKRVVTTGRVVLAAGVATHARLRRERRYHVRLRAAECAPGVRLRLRQGRAGGGEWVDTVPLTGDGRGWFDSTSDATDLAVEVVLPRGAHISTTVVVELEDVGPRPRLDRFVLIPGAMKSATSTLHGYLRQHPRLVPARRKEPQHFTSPHAPGGLAAYRDWFRFDGRSDVDGLDASTGYTKYPTMPDVASRIAEIPASFRFIYVMRDPVDRIESHLAHNVARGRVALEAAAEERQLRHAVAVSSYAAQLERYAAAFGDLDDRLLLLDFDDLVATPIETVRRVERFLGLEPHEYAPVGVRNERAAARGAEHVRLETSQRSALRARLEDDVCRLITVHGFDPARRWLDEES